jgi:tetratricopeptide (TPR) repeat protein
LSRAAQIDHADVAARLELARLYREAGRTDEAIASLREVVSLTPDDSWAWLELGELYVEQEDIVAANSCFTEALRQDPRSIQALMRKAEMEELQQFDSRALEYYHRVLAIEENHPEAMIRIARIHMRNEEPMRASVLLRSTCHCRGATPAQIAEARWLLGLSYGQLNRWQDAEESLQIAVEVMQHPGANDLYYLAYAQYQQHEAGKAQETIARILKLRPDHDPALVMKQALEYERDDLQKDVQLAGYRQRTIPPPPRGWENVEGTARIKDR